MTMHQHWFRKWLGNRHQAIIRSMWMMTHGTHWYNINVTSSLIVWAHTQNGPWRLNVLNDHCYEVILINISKHYIQFCDDIIILLYLIWEPSLSNFSNFPQIQKCDFFCSKSWAVLIIGVASSNMHLTTPKVTDVFFIRKQVEIL